MTTRDRTKNNLRCFCRSTPLLAVYGILENGDLYLHVRVFKQSQIYGEMFVQKIGIVKLRCRNCLRWHKVTLRQPNVAELEETDAPPVNPAN